MKAEQRRTSQDLSRAKSLWNCDLLLNESVKAEQYWKYVSDGIVAFWSFRRLYAHWRSVLASLKRADRDGETISAFELNKSWKCWRRIESLAGESSYRNKKSRRFFAQSHKYFIAQKRSNQYSGNKMRECERKTWFVGVAVAKKVIVCLSECVKELYERRRRPKATAWLERSTANILLPTAYSAIIVFIQFTSVVNKISNLQWLPKDNRSASRSSEETRMIFGELDPLCKP